ncbi:MAG: histidine phosphatase family protein [Bdellovibrio sp.]|nr:histidine phosphatase family protein [Bdellovibrio sp.]
MKLKNIYVIRHGETDWNKNSRFQGRTDIKLNDQGREQAALLRPVMQQLQIESVYASSLARAYETAEIATGDLKLTIQKEDRLRETNIGEAEGMTIDEINEKYGEGNLQKWRSYEERLLDFRFPNGESKREVMFRLRQVFLDIAQNSNRSSIAVFSHGMIMRAMTFVFSTGIPWEQHVFHNGSVHHYLWSGEDTERLIYKGKLNP